VEYKVEHHTLISALDFGHVWTGSAMDGGEVSRHGIR
jgi:hypothetical protein